MSALPSTLKRLDQQPESIEFHMADGIFVKTMHVFKAGTFIPQHVHKYDHVSFLAAGAVKVWRDGDLYGVFTAPNAIHIKAGVAHMFEALRDDTMVLCIHNVSRSPDGAVEIEREHAVEYSGE